MEPELISELDIWVDGRRVGRLAKGRPGQSEYQFIYDRAVPMDSALSLTMPPDVLVYESPAILPAFQQNLPEMDLSPYPEQIKKLVIMNEMGQLWLAGNRRIGRIVCTRPGQTPERTANLKLDPLEIEQSKDGIALFNAILARSVSIPAISGQQPKTLAPLSEVGSDEHVSYATDTHILKTAGTGLAGITLVEHLCLNASRASKIETAESVLSADGRLLAIRRFDLDESGKPLGFDEACGLMGMLSFAKYSGSYERMVSSISTFLSDDHRKEDLRKLFQQLTLMLAIRNGDAHLKNFGLLYTHLDDARLAPAYDVVTTVCFDYLKDDTPALTLGGKKSWDALKYLKQIGQQRCMLSPAEIDGIFNEVAQGVRDTLPLVERYQAQYPWANDALENMKQAWKEGAETLKPEQQDSAPGESLS